MKFNLKPVVLTVCMSVLLVSSSKAQTFNDPLHVRANTYEYEGIEGSPFLNDDWLRGSVKLTDNSIYNHLQLKYNVQEDILYFKGNNDEVLTFVVPVKEFSIENTANITQRFRNGFIMSDFPANAFMEVMADGTVQLLKKATKYAEFSKEYNAGPVKKMVTSVKYYLAKADKIVPIKPADKKMLLAVLGNHQSELEAFIKEKSLNLKKDSDLVSFITYYNSL